MTFLFKPLKEVYFRDVFFITSVERVGDLSGNSVFRLMAADKADKYCPPLMRPRWDRARRLHSLWREI